MSRDNRYKTVKLLIESNIITEFNQIFTYIPKSVVSEDMGINYSRFVRQLQQVDLFRLKELIILSSFFEVDQKVFIDLVLSQYHSDKKVKTKK